MTSGDHRVLYHIALHIRNYGPIEPWNATYRVAAMRLHRTRYYTIYQVPGNLVTLVYIYIGTSNTRGRFAQLLIVILMR